MKKAVQDNSITSEIATFKNTIRIEPGNPLAYNKLMILYRKEKMYKEELQLINDAIKNIQAAYDNKKSKVKTNATILKLSAALMKSMGLIDKKGKSAYEPVPIKAWKKRKETVLKRMKIVNKSKTN